MSKNKMIKLIQLKEAKLYLELIRFEKAFGENDIATQKKRGEWNAIYSLMIDLEITSDNYLEDNVNASELSYEYYK